MKHSLHDIELIERYFDHGLSHDERAMLDAKLKDDPGFQKMFEHEKLLVNTIRFGAAQTELTFLKQKEKELSSLERGIFGRRWFILAAAASVAIVILVVFAPSWDQSAIDLYEAYMNPYPNVFESNTRARTDVSARSEAFRAYDQGDYERSSLLFTNLIAENAANKDAGVLMLLGNSNLMIGKTEVAHANFTDLLQNYDAYDGEAKWFLGLIHLKKGEKEEAKKYFDEVAAGEGVFSVKAAEVSGKLGR